MTWKVGDIFQIKDSYWRDSVFVVIDVYENSFFDMICLFDDANKHDWQKENKCDWYYHTWYRQRLYENWVKL